MTDTDRLRLAARMRGTTGPAPWAIVVTIPTAALPTLLRSDDGTDRPDPWREMASFHPLSSEPPAGLAGAFQPASQDLVEGLEEPTDGAEVKVRADLKLLRPRPADQPKPTGIPWVI